MRKINPKELLDCLDSLLGRRGGIKGDNEVERMADLMKKFSKKLVSKCIYIQILKNTEPGLLSKFMDYGGWELVYHWLIRSIEHSNDALIREILELFLVCPVNIDHLKLNNCPKVIKALSRDSEDEEIRTLCNKVVDKWLNFVRCGRAAISDVAIEAAAAAAPETNCPKKTIAIPITIPKNKITVVGPLSTNAVPATIIQKMTNIPIKIATKSNIEVVDVSSGDEWEDGQYARIGTLQGIEGLQRIQNIQGITKIQGIRTVQKIQEISSVKRIQEITQVQKIHGLQGIHGLQNVHGIQGFQEINGVDTVGDVSEVQEVEELEVGQEDEIETLETIETLEEMEPMETVETIEPFETTGEDEEDLEVAEEYVEGVEALEEDEEEVEEVEEMEEVEEVEEIEEEPQQVIIENERKPEIPRTGTLPLYKITVKDGKKILAQVGTKTLTLPIPKKPEPKPVQNTVASLIIKSDPITKQYRYVSSKDKVSVSEPVKKQFVVREKSQSKSDQKLRVAPMVLIHKLEKANQNNGEKPSDAGSFELVKQKSSESLLKSYHIKSHKDDKVKDSHEKSSKSHKDRDSHRSDSKHREKDKKDRESSKDKKRSEHKSHSSDKDKDKEKEKEKEKEKDKEKDKEKEKERSKHRDKESASSKSKSDHKHKDSHRSKSRDKDDKSKDKNVSKSVDKSQKSSEKTQSETEKEKDNPEKPKPNFSVVCKIPKKSSSLPAGGNQTSLPKVVYPKQNDSPQTGDKVSKISVDVKKPGESKSSPKERPKTVKTYHSKFRLTGLEGDVKSPPGASTSRKKSEAKRPASKSRRPLHDDLSLEKKIRISQILAEYKRQKLLQKPGSIKLIPPKPKPALLESDMFSDALTASTKDTRKKKRRASTSKDKATPKPETVTSPEEAKPALQFYRDTLEEDEKSTESKRPRTESESDSKNESTGDVTSKLYPNGVLVLKARQGPKKSVKWKEEPELTKIKYFELDENERINVTRNFIDLKLLERNNEREAFQLARKLANDDNMEEKIPWGPLLIVDVPPERIPPIEPGRDSQEKKIQYAREKTVLQAIYFHRSSIPDSPAEPDVEYHITTDPKIIPLDDITGNEDSITSFRNIPWPEPKPVLIPTSPPHTQQIPNALQPQTQQPQGQQQPPQPQAQGFAPGYSTVGNFSGYPSVGMHGMMATGQNTWRTADGKDMGVNLTFQMDGPMNIPQMNQPPTLFTSHAPENYNVSGPQMGNFNSGYPMNCDPNMFVPSQVNMPGPPPPQWNRNWQGGNNRSGGGGGSSGSGSGGQHYPSKYHKGVCHHFSKYGGCARGSSCRFMHPN